MKKILTIVLGLSLAVFTASADEGMWLIQSIDKALAKNMKARGLKLSPGEIYNADAEGATISDAVVSLEFGCTGSMISKEGLMITNHHCAYEDVFNLSTEEHNYLKDGFWALHRDQEVRIPGKSVWFLKSVVDVTDYALEYLSHQKNTAGMAMRRHLGAIEDHFQKEGVESMLYPMWSGSKYYMAYYTVYKDVRLVAAPPTSIAAFGGDIDNWDWPQHKCDFAMYRIYTAPDGSPAEYAEENVPMVPKKVLTISTKGIKKGSFAMVIGYPGTTQRYSSSAKVDYLASSKLHTSNQIRQGVMDIMKSHMELDPSVSLKYSNKFFGLSNVQELYSGEEKCIRRFNVVDEKKEIEKDLQKWIEEDADRRQKWGSLVSELWDTYARIEETERNFAYYRESIIRGSSISTLVYRINNIEQEAKKLKVDRDAKYPVVGGKPYNMLKDVVATLDMKLEKDLFYNSMRVYFNSIDPKWLGEGQAELYERFGHDASAVADYLWNSSYLTSDVMAFVEADTLHTINEYASDPIVKFFNEVGAVKFNKAISDIQGNRTVSSLGREYTHALYQYRQEKGIPQYPDANSSMRITYGVVGGLEPADAVHKDYYSTAVGILEKYDPYSYDFDLTEKQRTALAKVPSMVVNFATDNDITGGNSGSPVMNARGELIGLAFDGNTESLAGDVSFTQQYTKCICVDIRYVLWILDQYLPDIRKELTIK